jgi:hypothetical protein
MRGCRLRDAGLTKRYMIVCLQRHPSHEGTEQDKTFLFTQATRAQAWARRLFLRLVLVY